ncbi:MAG: hypothetical protein ACOYLG_13205 [Chitinophagaceae bacterium]
MKKIRIIALMVLGLMFALPLFSTKSDIGMKAAASATLMVAPFASIYKSKEDADKAEQEFEASIKDLTDENKEVARAARKATLDAISEGMKNLITPDELNKELDAIREEYKTEKDLINQVLIKHGVAIQRINNPFGPTKEQKMTIVKAFEDKMDQIKSFLANQSEGQTLTIYSNKTAVNMTTANSVDNTALNNDVVENFRIDGMVKQRQGKQYIFDIADRTTSQSVPEFIIWDEEADAEGAFAVVSEGALKPLTSYSLVKKQSQVKKIAGKKVVSTEFDTFRQRLSRYVNELFNDKLLRDYQTQLTTELGLLAASYTGTTLDGQITDPTDFHAIGAVAAQIESLNFSPNVLIINPQDKWRIALTTNGEGSFHVATLPITGANGQVQMMSFLTVTTTEIAAGTAILGEGNLFKIEDTPVNLKLTYGLTTTSGGGNITSAEFDTDYNRMRLIGEMFYHSYMASVHTGSFVEFEFETVKAALATA